jgi:hypothetical protein
MRRLVGRDSIIRFVAAATTVQLAKVGRDLVLQYEPHSPGVVESLGYSRGAFQPGTSDCMVIYGREVAEIAARFVVITILMLGSSHWIPYDNLPCVSWRRKNWRISSSRRTS